MNKHILLSVIVLLVCNTGVSFCQTTKNKSENSSSTTPAYIDECKQGCSVNAQTQAASMTETEYYIKTEVGKGGDTYGLGEMVKKSQISKKSDTVKKSQISKKSDTVKKSQKSKNSDTVKKSQKSNNSATAKVNYNEKGFTQANKIFKSSQTTTGPITSSNNGGSNDSRQKTVGTEKKPSTQSTKMGRRLNKECKKGACN